MTALRKSASIGLIGVKAVSYTHLVITFTDITGAKKLEAAAQKSHTNLEERFTHQTEELGKSQKNLKTEISRRSRIKPNRARPLGSKQKPKKLR